ncbi:MAG: ABC transporter ATP-binding protein [Actinomycetota bacterium]|nr:ABC transporter ATP-binding protein [Actinomycetota bacterium]
MDGLRVSGITKRYGEKTVVSELSLAVEPGTVASLVGPNGCGKTTTLGMIAGLRTPDSGRISVSGYDTIGSPLDARRNLAFVPDTPSGFEQLNVREYMDLYQSLYRQPRVRYEERARVVLEAFGLLEYNETNLGELSHGMRRKAATTAALSLDVPNVLIDEPTVGLDPESAVVLRRLVKHIGRSGSAVLLATQDLAFAERVCDRLFLIHNGRLIADGSPALLLGRYHANSIEEAFLAATGIERRIDDFEQRLETFPR